MRRLPWLIGALGGVLLLAGVLILALAAPGPGVVVYDGSYAPLAEVGSAYESSLSLTFDDPPVVAWTARQALGAGLAALGLLVLVALAGWLLGRRRGPAHGMTATGRAARES